MTMSSTASVIRLTAGETVSKSFSLDTSRLVPGTYLLSFAIFETGENGADQNIDVLRDIVTLTVLADDGFNHGMTWNSQWWGHVSAGELTEIEKEA